MIIETATMMTTIVTTVKQGKKKAYYYYYHDHQQKQQQWQQVNYSPSAPFIICHANLQCISDVLIGIRETEYGFGWRETTSGTDD